MNEENLGDFVEDDPMAASMNSGRGRRPRRSGSAQLAEGRWSRAKEKATAARERSELFLRENPVPMILGALVAGLAIGLAIRYASRAEEREEAPLLNTHWSALSIPFLWPFFRSVRDKYQESADAMKHGIRNIDVDRYTKPLRKRWKSWTH